MSPKEGPTGLPRLIKLLQNSEVLCWVLLNLIFISIGGIILSGYYQSPVTTRPAARISDIKFTLIEPHNIETTIVNDTYDRLIDLKNFTFLINPPTCANYPAGLLLAVIVSSKPDHYDLRSTIRNTWGHADDCTKVFFLMGETNNEKVNHKILHESLAYGDIVQGNFVDTYRNLTYKHVMGLKWIAHHCSSAKYILKTDDDVFVNTRALRRYLAKDLSPWGAKGLLAGKLITRPRVVREGKWNVTKEEVPADRYPSHCAGYAVIYSQDVVARLLSACQSLPYFWIDDVQVTGVCAEKAGVNHTSIWSLMLNWRQTNSLLSQGQNAFGPFIFGPPNVRVERMKEIWKAISD